MKKWMTAVLLAVLVMVPLGVASVNAEEDSEELSSGYLVCFREGCDEHTEGMTHIHGLLYQVDDLSLLDGREEDVEYIESDDFVEMPPARRPLMAASPSASAAMPWQVAMVGPEAAWDYNTYGQSVKVAVIDTGCNAHKQLVNALCGGWNFVSKNDDYSDANGHGTNVAGILAASAGERAVGIAPKVELYALRCWEDGKTSPLSILAEAVYAAVDDFGCQVINLSFQTTTDSISFHNALMYAKEKGVILVGASGNSGDDVLQYPAAYPEVISVASVGKDKSVSSFSSYNRNVFVTAPGESYISCYSTSSYSTMSGTSQSCPVVAGAAALMLSINPDMTEAEFRRLLIDTSEDLEARGRDEYTGYGLIRIPAMVEKLLEDCDVYVSPIDKETETATLYNLSSSAETVCLFRSIEVDDRYASGELAWQEVESGQSIRLSLDHWSAGEVLHVLGGEDGFMPLMKRKYS